MLVHLCEGSIPPGIEARCGRLSSDSDRSKRCRASKPTACLLHDNTSGKPSALGHVVFNINRWSRMSGTHSWRVGQQSRCCLAWASQ